MKDWKEHGSKQTGLTRRAFLWTLMAGSVASVCGTWLLRLLKTRKMLAESFIASLSNYRADISGTIKSGLLELGISQGEIAGKRILIKPNLVETIAGAVHINTHPLVIHGAIEAFMARGAAEILVGEGPGHCRDSLFLLEDSGLMELLAENRVRFVDFNYDKVYSVTNAGGLSRLNELVLPETLQKVDWVVSMAKMKTHHWAGVTLSMKNLFGVMPGSYYGWPKNVLHWAGINETILDIYAALRPHLAIVDGIIGMEGDGPIMGTPHPVGVLVMGRNYPAVDATCARIMGIDPYKVPHLAAADGSLGSIREANIKQKGENIASVRTDFALIDKIPAHKSIRLQYKRLM